MLGIIFLIFVGSLGIIAPGGVIMITNEFNKKLRSISDALRDLGYTDSTIGLRQRYWKEYYHYHGSFEVDKKSMDDFLREAYDIDKNNSNVTKRLKYEVRAAIRNLYEFHQHGKIINYHTPWFKDMPWVQSYKAVVDEFIESIVKKGCKPKTVLNYVRTIKKLTNHLHSIGVESFNEVKPSHITSFLVDSVNEITHNLKAILCNLRALFRYLYLNGYNSEDLSLFIPKSNILLKRKHIPTTWTKDDVNKILSCVDVANPVGKRDYAMILMVARLGIRVSDIVQLEFNNIKWG